MTVSKKHDYLTVWPSTNTATGLYVQKERLGYNQTAYNVMKAQGIVVPDSVYKNRSLVMEQSGSQTDRGVVTKTFYVSHRAFSVDEFRKATLKSNTISAASKKFYDKLGKVDSFNMAVSLAEAGESIAMIANTAKQLATSFRHLKKGRIGLAIRTLRGDLNGRLTDRDVAIAGLNTRRSGWSIKEHVDYVTRRLPKSKNGVAKAASSSWLQFQYGWTPLLLDAYGAAQYAATEINRRSYDFTVKAGAQVTDTYQKSDVSSSNWRYTYTAYETWTVVHTRRYKLDLLISDPTLRMAEALGLTNPMLIAWELVPLSFVIDWFIPVGDSLAQLTARQGYQVVNGSVSDKIVEEGQGSFQMRRYLTSPQARYVNTVAAIKWSQSSYTRAASGWPSFTWPSLDVWGALSPRKIATTLSLAVTAFLK